jgi:hypothetical protein
LTYLVAPTPSRTWKAFSIGTPSFDLEAPEEDKIKFKKSEKCITLQLAVHDYGLILKLKHLIITTQLWSLMRYGLAFQV